MYMSCLYMVYTWYIHGIYQQPALMWHQDAAQQEQIVRKAETRQRSKADWA
jgi:hypothetical protein